MYSWELTSWYWVLGDTWLVGHRKMMLRCLLWSRQPWFGVYSWESLQILDIKLLLDWSDLWICQLLRECLKLHMLPQSLFVLLTMSLEVKILSTWLDGLVSNNQHTLNDLSFNETMLRCCSQSQHIESFVWSVL